MMSLKNFMLFLILLPLISSCSGNKSKLSIEIIPVEGGTTDPESGSFDIGDEIEIWAIPNNGWTVSGWLGDVNRKVNPLKLTIDSNVNIQVVFVRCGDKIEDVDGNKYSTVRIGNQCWMAENLQTTKYQNGDQIHEAQTISELESTDLGAWTYYNFNSSNHDSYGKLYNWYAVDDSRNICPAGWEVPTHNDNSFLNFSWHTLVKQLDPHANLYSNNDVESSTAGGALKEEGNMHWNSPNFSASNNSGFTARPGGIFNNGSFGGLRNSAYFWSSSTFAFGAPSARLIWNQSSSVRIISFNKNSALSIRCVYDVENLIGFN